MSEDEDFDPHERHYTTEGLLTIVRDEGTNETLAVLDFPLFPPRGSIIELGNPNRDATVLETRVGLPQRSDGPGQINIVVIVQQHDGTVLRDQGIR